MSVPANAGEADASTVVRLTIPAGPLDRALQALATQSRIQILYAPELIERLHARGLQARMSPPQALRLLLQDSGVEAVAVNANTYILRAVPPSIAEPKAEPAKPVQRPTELATVQVTGTHIPRASLEVVTPAPLTIISRAEIEASGGQTLFELLSYQPGMVSHHPVEVASDGGSRSQQLFGAAATTSLYGLGPRATLFLVNGRRVANYGLVSANLGGLTDLDGIPLGMIERIEIMRGGASAIYGADAMAGVVNIILKQDQSGGEVAVRYGLSEYGDAEQGRITAGYGQGTGRGGNFFINADYFRRRSLLGDARDWRSSDLRRLGLGDWRIPLGYRDLSDGTLVQPACPEAQRDAEGGCFLDRARYITLQPEMESRSVYATLQQPLTEKVELRADLRLGQVEQTLQGAPFFGRLTLPTGHPDDLDLGRQTLLSYAFFDVGPVRSRSRSETRDLTLGLAGYRGQWQWQLDLGHHRNDVDNQLDGMISNSAYNRVVEDLSYRFNSSGNDPAIARGLSPRLQSKGISQLDQLIFSANGPAFSLPGGAAQIAVGAEFGRDSLYNEPDQHIREQDIALGAQKISIDEHRYQSAFYAELSLPLTRQFHADLAWRLDHREGYGSESSPKLGLKWNVLDSLILRGTAATGYRAPSLFELRRPSVSNVLEGVLETPALAPCAISLPTTGGQRECLVVHGSMENPGLQPETSRSHTLGMVWAPSPSFEASLDYFRIRRRNEIVTTDALDNPELFPRALERDARGRLVAINDYYENIGRTEVRGWELQGSYRIDTVRLGRFALRASASYLEELGRQVRANTPKVDYAGYGVPQRAALASLEWMYGDWTSMLTLHARGPMKVGGPAEPCPEWNAAVGKCTTPAANTLDLYLAYAGIPGWRLSLNVANLADREPVNYDIAKGGYDLAYDDPRGRYYLFSAAYRF